MLTSPNVTSDAILPAQLRAGRALLAWTQEHLASVSAVPKRTIARLELGKSAPQRRTTAALRAALEGAGVEFMNGDAPGVRLRRTDERARWSD